MNGVAGVATGTIEFCGKFRNVLKVLGKRMNIVEVVGQPSGVIAGTSDVVVASVVSGAGKVEGLIGIGIVSEFAS